MSTSIRLALGAGCIALVAFAQAPAQQVYTWKDAKGVTHYSDSPPPKGANARTVAVPAAPPAPPPTAKPKPAAPATVASAAAPVVDPAVAQAAAEQRAAACKRAQENLAVLQQTNAAVGVDEDGDGKNDAVLSTEQRTAQTTSMQAAVQANCVAATP